MKSHTLEQALPQLPDDIYVTGKGGVGKSSVAMRIAKIRGSQLFVMEERGAPRGAIVVPAREAVEDAAAIAFNSRRLARLVLRPRAIRRFLAVTPGLAELCRMMKVQREKRRKTTDLPATGHAIDWLAGPEKFLTIVQSGRGRGMIIDLLEAWKNPERSGLLVVTTPEALVVSETKALIAALESQSPMAISAVLINKGLRCSEVVESELRTHASAGSEEAARAVHRIQATKAAEKAFARYPTILMEFDVQIGEAIAA